MLANHAARVATVAARLRTKARRVRGPAQRQLRRIKYLFAMIIRDRHFRCRHEIKLTRIIELEKIGFKLRQLSRAEKCGAIDDERRQRFDITMLARLHFEHEVDQRAFESRTRAVEDRKTRRSDLRGAFEIEYAECAAEIDVVLRFEIKLRRLSPATNFSIRRLIRSDRNTLMR